MRVNCLTLSDWDDLREKCVTGECNYFLGYAPNGIENQIKLSDSFHDAIYQVSYPYRPYYDGVHCQDKAGNVVDVFRTVDFDNIFLIGLDKADYQYLSELDPEELIDWAKRTVAYMEYINIYN